jgi:hypothetical protein
MRGNFTSKRHAVRPLTAAHQSPRSGPPPGCRSTYGSL